MLALVLFRTDSSTYELLAVDCLASVNSPIEICIYVFDSLVNLYCQDFSGYGIGLCFISYRFIIKLIRLWSKIDLSALITFMKHHLISLYGVLHVILQTALLNRLIDWRKRYKHSYKINRYYNSYLICNQIIFNFSCCHHLPNTIVCLW